MSLVPYKPRKASSRAGKSARYPDPSRDITRAIAGMVLGNVGSKAGGYAGAQAGKRVGRAIGYRKGGKAVGRFVGSIAGGLAGASAGRRMFPMRTLTGSGAYAISNDTGNLVMDQTQQYMTVSRSEYVGDVYSGTGTPTTFNSTIYQVNPGLDTNNGGSFTWLPQVARAYEEYKFEQLVFEYRPTSGSATGSDTSVGEVILSGQYRNSSEDFANKQQMLNSMFATSAAPYTKQYFAVELARLSRPFAWHNVRDADLPANSDLDLADTIKLTVATQGCPTASQNLGSLYVHYKVKFQKPTVDPSDSNIQGAVAYIAGATDICTEASPFSSSVNNVHTVSGNTFPLELITSAANTGRIRFPKSFGPPGSLWQFNILHKGNSTAITFASVLGTHNGFSAYQCIFAQNQNDGGGAATATSSITNTGATSTISSYLVYMKFDGVDDGSQPYVEISLAASTIPASCTDCWVSVSRVNNAAFDNPLV